ncbi:MAG: sialate O-acetylesterase [Verrucomicrobia bacterium]|nr:sialate O-acetylesterase [Verrucomicrobiota bacterium]
MSKPVQVFILLGQSNMLGFGKVPGAEKDGTLEHAVKTKKLYPYLVDDTGTWTTRQDVRFVRVMNDRQFNNEFMTIKGNIGPEIGIGHHVGNVTDAPVMILKSCIGNRSLGWDLLPPGSPRYSVDGQECPGYMETVKSKKDKTIVPFVAGGDCLQWYAGKQYDSDIGAAKKVLANLDKHYPGAKGYQVAGFCWWQGDKDFRNKAHAAKYEDNLIALFKALKKDFDCPDAKLVIATLGQTKKDADGTLGQIINAMFNVADSSKYPENKGKVATFYSNPVSKGGSSSGHYSKHAETYMNVGEGMGAAMAELLTAK